MAKGTRRSLPLALDILANARAKSRTPTVDAARRMFGGRGASEPGVGKLVRVETAEGSILGVLLFTTHSECDVFMEDATVRRMRPERVAALLDDAPEELVAIARDATAFGALEEGDRVCFASKQGEMSEGTLVEKCRYGALVLTLSGTIVAVGFRKLFAAPQERPS
jgi:hypothetical protein